MSVCNPPLSPICYLAIRSHDLHNPQTELSNACILFAECHRLPVR